MTPDAAEVVTIGETLALFAQGEPGVVRSGMSFTFRIGGSESNVAIGLARLGVPAAWIGRVGRDPFGAEIVRAIRGEGVRVLAHLDDALPTGLMVKDRRTGTHQRVSYYRSGSAGSALSSADVDDAAVGAAALLHTSGITLAVSAGAAAAAGHAIDVAAANGTRVSFDVNHRTRLWSPEIAREGILAVLPRVDLLFAGLDEARMLLGDDGAEASVATARRLMELGPDEVVLKMGASGALGVTRTADAFSPATPVAVVDTVGAGDAFVAGYLAAALRGDDLAERLRVACRTGAFACTGPGDWEGGGDWEDIALLDSGDPVQR